MASKQPWATAVALDDEITDQPTFDVVVQAVIGKVVIDPQGSMSAHVAAFSIIAEHDTPGLYSFPLPDGRTCQVEVAYVQPV